VIPRPRHNPRPPQKPKKASEPVKKSEKKEDCSKKEDCCVCYESMPASEVLGCSHPVCKGCLKQLRDDRCPICRAEIKSKYISDKDKKKMAQRKREDALDRANEAFRNYLASQQQATIVIPSGPGRVPIVLGGGSSASGIMNMFGL